MDSFVVDAHKETPNLACVVRLCNPIGRGRANGTASSVAVTDEGTRDRVSLKKGHWPEDLSDVSGHGTVIMVVEATTLLGESVSISSPVIALIVGHLFESRSYCTNY